MVIFIDESGDAGFKLDKGSSETFVICLVVFDDELDAEETALKIKKLRRSLNKRDSFEFKFNKCSKDLKVKFLNEIKSCRFRIRCIAIRKNIIHSELLKNKKDSFYNYALKVLLEHNSNTIKSAKLRIDGSGERAFRRNLTNYLRRNLNSKTSTIMSNLKFRDSKEDVLIQLADMVAGSIRRSYEQQYSDSKIYRKIIAKRIEDCWEFK